MNIKRVLAASIFGSLLWMSGAAEATQWPVTLTSVLNYINSPASPANISFSTATWVYDDVTGILTQTGGTFEQRYSAGPTLVYRDQTTGLIIGNTGIGLNNALASTYQCIEGSFGAAVGVSICGNYNFGTNTINESTVTYGPGTLVNRVLGGDDVALGGAYNYQYFNGFQTVSFVPPNQLVMANGVCAVGRTGYPGCAGRTDNANFGYKFIFGGAGGDAIPDPFTFSDVSGVALSATQTSNSVTITGTDTAALITVSGGLYSVGCTGSFTAAAGSINPGQTVCVRHTSSASNGAAVNTTLTVGGVSDTFTSTTATDTTPDAFGFPDQIQQPLFSLVTSNAVTITGINGPAAVTVTGGQYSIGCTPTFTGVPGVITNGQTVCVRQTTASTNGGRVNTRLTVGGVDGLFFTTALLADPVVVPDTPPAPTPAVDPPVILFNKTQPATQATIQDIGIETDGLVTGGTAVIGFCTAVDPRDTEGPGNSFKPRPLALSELSASCSSLVGETLVIPAYMRPIPDAGGVRRFVISTASSTAEFEGALVSQGYGQDIVTYAGGVRPPCNVPLSSRPLWLWGERVGEDVDGVLTDENQVMKPVAAQCNASRSVTKKASNFVQNVSLDESVYSSASYAAGQNTDLDKVLDKLDADDNSCSVALQSVTTAMKTQAAICRTATVFAIVTRDTSVPEVRLTRTVYQYAMKLKLRNYGGPVLASQAVIRSGVPSTTVVGGVATKIFGAIPPGVGGGYAETGEQSFTIQQDRLLPVDPGVVLPAVSFTPDLTGGNSTRYSAAIAGCEQVARLAKQNRPAFDSCPVAVKAKKYRGALIGGGLGAAFTIYDRLARPTSGGTWSIYPLPTDIIEPAQIPPGP